jgi:hypothetical protein
MAEQASTQPLLDIAFGPAPLPVRQNTTSLQTAIDKGTVGVGYSGSG